MSLLACQHPQKLQKQVTSKHINLKNSLYQPSQLDLQDQKGFQSGIFKSASPGVRSLVYKKLPLGRRIRSINANQDNSVVKVFIYNFLMIIYEPTSSSVTTNLPKKTNSDLLARLRDHINSQDVKFYSIQFEKRKISYSDQRKAIVQQFLTFIENFKKHAKSQNQVLNCIEQLLNRNQALFQTFTMITWQIIRKINGATANNEMLKQKPELIIRLFEYFGLKSRYQNGIIMLYEVGYFITFIENIIVFGDYNSQQFGHNKENFASKLNVKKQNQTTKAKSQQSQQKNISLQHESSKRQSKETKAFSSRKDSQDESDLLYEQLREQFAKVILDFDQDNNQSCQSLEIKDNLSTRNTDSRHCHCFEFKIKKNSCHSKVIEFSFQPHIKSKQINTPSFLAKSKAKLREGETKPKNNLLSQPIKNDLQFSQARQEKIPAFIKSRKLLGSYLNAPRQRNSREQQKDTQSVYKQLCKNVSESFLNHQNIKKSDFLVPPNKMLNLKNFQQAARMFELNHIRTQSLFDQSLNKWKTSSNFQNLSMYGVNIMDSVELPIQNHKTNFLAPLNTNTNQAQKRIVFRDNKGNMKVSKLMKSVSFKRLETTSALKTELNESLTLKLLSAKPRIGS